MTSFLVIVLFLILCGPSFSEPVHSDKEGNVLVDRQSNRDARFHETLLQPVESATTRTESGMDSRYVATQHGMCVRAFPCLRRRFIRRNSAGLR